MFTKLTIKLRKKLLTYWEDSRYIDNVLESEGFNYNGVLDKI